MDDVYVIGPQTFWAWSQLYTSFEGTVGPRGPTVRVPTVWGPKIPKNPEKLLLRIEVGPHVPMYPMATVMFVEHLWSELLQATKTNPANHIFQIQIKIVVTELAKLGGSNLLHSMMSRWSDFVFRFIFSLERRPTGGAPPSFQCTQIISCTKLASQTLVTKVAETKEELFGY